MSKMIPLIIYIIGYIITVIMLKKVIGNKIIIESSADKDDVSMTYTIMSLIWPLIWLIGIIIGTFSLLTYITNKI